MRLSEAILLGDSLRDRNWDVFLDTTTTPPCGCALGGAQLAMGRTDIQGYRDLWPWVHDKAAMESEFRDLLYEDHIGVVDAAGHPNFFDVVKGSCTIEQLADYVRSIEPSCGECNQFTCTCVQKTDEVSTVAELQSH
jgi:hypothetical protein